MLHPLLSATRVQRPRNQPRLSTSASSVAPSGRFRANIHYQRGTLAASIRLLPAQIPTLENPSTCRPSSPASCGRKQGLVLLLAGPTGSGKTSTMAALVDIAVTPAAATACITIEDPVEYQRANRNSIVEQIEVGHDTPPSPRPSAPSSARTPTSSSSSAKMRGTAGHSCRTHRRRNRPPRPLFAPHQRRRPDHVPHPRQLLRRQPEPGSASSSPAAARRRRAAARSPAVGNSRPLPSGRNHDLATTAAIRNLIRFRPGPPDALAHLYRQSRRHDHHGPVPRRTRPRSAASTATPPSPTATTPTSSRSHLTH